MIDWRRREVLLGGLLTVLPLACSCPAHAQSYSGCWVPPQAATSNAAPGGLEGLDGVLVEKSGIDGLESALIQTLDDLAKLFGVLPGFSFYRENDEPNAKATSVDLMRNRPDGTVVFGIKLLRNLLKMEEYPDAGVVAVCAHEFAHILSYSNGAIATLKPPGSQSSIRAEQFADYMAGYYAGHRKHADQNFPAVVFAATTSLYGGGDHGTPTQRGAAVQQGFLAAYTGGYAPTQASQRALAFAMDVSA